ncbi:MAG TPA: oligopeptide transporter, OPT family [bacterium]|nr:oligopeptide transporter, OPT family [bacterium]
MTDRNDFRPFVAPTESLAEFTVKSAVAGVIFGVLFGAANTYLGLKAGLTVSTSIPIAVMTIAMFRAFRMAGGRSTILEHNLSQTIGSASSSLASGTIFTIPALYLWGVAPSFLYISLLALLGGVLGTAIMIPLRQYLIVQEHKNLPYPEGTACAEVLESAEGHGAQSRPLFLGMALAGIYEFGLGFLRLWKESPRTGIIGLPKAEVGLEASPALLGVGFILGPRIAAVMVAGAGLSWVVLIPILHWYGTTLTAPLFPETAKLLPDMTTQEIWGKYIRYLGAGAVAMAGIMTIIKAVPTMVQSFKLGLRGLRHGTAGDTSRPRTERDLSMRIVLGLVLAIAAAIVFIPHLVGGFETIAARIVVALAICIFAFFFVTVSSRIVGLIGVSSNPVSGMTIVTLLGTSFVFYLLGWTDGLGQMTALSIGTVVCVASSIAGDMSQDLKTGYLVGATPYKQQLGEFIGAITSAWGVAYAVDVLHHAYGFGTVALPAPQAMLMKTVIEGVLFAQLPWTLVFIGAGFALLAALLRIPALPFAVGLYLPLTTMTPIFAGGLVRWLVDRRGRANGDSGDRDRGVLLGSGFIAGVGLVRVGLAAWIYFVGLPEGIGEEWAGSFSGWLALALFGFLAWTLWRPGRKTA